MFSTTFSQLGLLIAVAICGSAVAFGARVERLVGVVTLTTWIASAAVQDRHFPAALDPGVFSLDVAYLLFVTGLAIRTDRRWLLFAAGFQVLTVAVHLAIAMDYTVGVRARITADYISSYLTLVALATGTVTSHLRLRTDRRDGRR